jgi:hypothetical protein
LSFLRRQESRDLVQAYSIVTSHHLYRSRGPTILDAVGIDSEKYTGWAFGFGTERLAMRKYEITDIRWLYKNVFRFLDQF